MKTYNIVINSTIEIQKEFSEEKALQKVKKEILNKLNLFINNDKFNNYSFEENMDFCHIESVSFYSSLGNEQVNFLFSISNLNLSQIESFYKNNFICNNDFTYEGFIIDNNKKEKFSFEKDFLFSDGVEFNIKNNPLEFIELLENYSKIKNSNVYNIENGFDVFSKETNLNKKENLIDFIEQNLSQRNQKTNNKQHKNHN